MKKIAEIQTGEDNPILRAKSVSVKRVDRVLAEELKETMLAEHGLGLAAPQIGVNERVFTMKLLRGVKNEQENETDAEDSDVQDYTVLVCANPEILEKSEEMVLGEEGCLSLPKVWEKVWRHERILVRFMDERGKEKILELSGLNARIFQHESDHLDGVLFIDRVER